MSKVFYFNGSSRIVAKVYASILCGCEGEGDILIAVPQNVEQGINNEVNNFVRILAFDGDMACRKTKPGEWVDAKLTFFGNIKKSSVNKIIYNSDLCTEKNEIKKIGILKIENNSGIVDFGFFVVSDISSNVFPSFLKIAHCSLIFDFAFLSR